MYKTCIVSTLDGYVSFPFDLIRRKVMKNSRLLTTALVLRALRRAVRGSCLRMGVLDGRDFHLAI